MCYVYLCGATAACAEYPRHGRPYVYVIRALTDSKGWERGGGGGGGDGCLMLVTKRDNFPSGAMRLELKT